jgi:hypothetical protein
MAKLVSALFVAMGAKEPDAALVDRIAEVAVSSPFVTAKDEETARTKTAALLVAIAYRESGGKVAAKGDSGSSFCAFQINLGKNGVTREGWTGEELTQDAGKCTAVAAKIALTSWNACKRAGLAEEERLAIYARGSCLSERGKKISRDRFSLAMTTLTKVLKKREELTDG